jgi:hypothetical protein
VLFFYWENGEEEGVRVDFLSARSVNRQNNGEIRQSTGRRLTK